MPGALDLIAVMQDVAANAGKGGAPVLFGQLVTLSPLKVKVDGNTNLVLSQDVLIPTFGMTNFRNIWYDQRPGDGVFLLNVSGGTKYLVFPLKLRESETT